MLDRVSTWTRPASAESAATASLVHTTDEGPGLRRRRAGKGFSYIDVDGRKVTDPETIDRINALAIPPAYTDVWISPDPDGHLQATGRDIRGRKQYRYHPRWTACRDEVKYSSLPHFARALPVLRTRIEEDLRRRGVPRERVLASVVWLLDNTMIRVGNAAYARDNKSFGLTTLRRRHVEIAGSKLRFAFRGKSGKEWDLQLVDRRMAKVLKGMQELPGQHLFKYRDEDGGLVTVTSHEVNDYLRETTGADFTSKHFRTWGGTISAAALFATTPVPETKRLVARTLNETIDRVAARLGNTRSVCRKCYVHPAVLDQWQEGTLGEAMKAARRSFRKVPDGLDEEEMLVLRWLERLAAASAA